METVGIFEAKTNLSHLIERVISGEEITISKRGVPVVVLSPVSLGKVDNRSVAIDAIKKFRKNRKKSKLMSADEIVNLVHEGRKY